MLPVLYAGNAPSKIILSRFVLLERRCNCGKYNMNIAHECFVHVQVNGMTSGSGCCPPFAKTRMGMYRIVRKRKTPFYSVGQAAGPNCCRFFFGPLVAMTTNTNLHGNYCLKRRKIVKQQIENIEQSKVSATTYDDTPCFIHENSNVY